MRRAMFTNGLLLALLMIASVAAAEETSIDVRVRSRGAKFIGTSMGGARVVIRDAETGEILAEGVTRGTTGDTARIMQDRRVADASLSTPDAAVFRAAVDIEQPTQILVEAIASPEVRVDSLQPLNQKREK